MENNNIEKNLFNSNAIQSKFHNNVTFGRYKATHVVNDVTKFFESKLLSEVNEGFVMEFIYCSSGIDDYDYSCYDTSVDIILKSDYFKPFCSLFTDENGVINDINMMYNCDIKEIDLFGTTGVIEEALNKFKGKKISFVPVGSDFTTTYERGKNFKIPENSFRRVIDELRGTEWDVSW